MDATEMSETARGRADPRELQILLAEDDSAMRTLLAWSLRRDGHSIIEAHDGHQLLDLLGAFALEDNMPDLIVTDVRMPGLSGLEVLRAAGLSDGRIPVIVMTAFGSPETHEAAKRLGAIAVFDKPFDPDDLRRFIQKSQAVLEGGPSWTPCGS
jgi:CheY-like chemotaxis protein